MASRSPTKPGHESMASAASLSVNLSSNNPFRNRAASPTGADSSLTSTMSPFDDPPPARPLSRNPFIDQPPPPLKSPGAASANSEPRSLSAEDIFDSLTLDDNSKSGDKAKSTPTDSQGRRPTDSKRRPHREQMAPPSGAPKKSGLSGSRPGASVSPQRKPQRQSRRNSETSVMDFDSRPITEEELKMIEERRRDRERERQRRPEQSGGKDKDATKPREGGNAEKKRPSRTKSGRPSRRLDIIDQLDATSIYGTGLFHHDGPFDALNPHRNRNASRRAPMQAFPKDSLNNSIGGAGPVNPNPDHAQFLGTNQPEAFRDYAAGGRARNGYIYPPGAREDGGAIFDPASRGSLVHGDESYGLGTSTFLEGTPAAKTAIERHQQEQALSQADIGLQRKKSLAQRIRHINKGPREYGHAGRQTNPEGVQFRLSPDAAPSSMSAGSEANPFFSEFSKGEDSITVKPRDGGPSPPMPRRGSGAALERRATTDATPGVDDAPTKPTGILGRMKSLKAPKKPRTNEAATSSQGPTQGAAV